MSEPQLSSWDDDGGPECGWLKEPGDIRHGCTLPAGHSGSCRPDPAVKPEQCHPRESGAAAMTQSKENDVTTDQQGSQVGPHDLVISHGDCEFFVFCSCGTSLADQIRPDRLESGFGEFGQRWERHVMAEHRDCPCEPCSW